MDLMDFLIEQSFYSVPKLHDLLKARTNPQFILDPNPLSVLPIRTNLTDPNLFWPIG